MSDLCPSCGLPGTMLDRQYRGQSGNAALWRKRKCPHCGTWETVEVDKLEFERLLRRARTNLRKSTRAVVHMDREITKFLRELEPPKKRAAKASLKSNGLQPASTKVNSNKETANA